MGLDYYPSVLFETLPALYDELADDFRETYGEELPASALPQVLRFGSWIGGDRDGNPLVTPEVPRRDALQIAREMILGTTSTRVNDLIWQLSPSTHQVTVSTQLWSNSQLYASSVRRLGSIRRDIRHKKSIVFLDYVLARWSWRERAQQHDVLTRAPPSSARSAASRVEVSLCKRR